ncbi:hypothetical protein EH206_16620 [Brenneria nigrifluens DSM 30175 = ATCC 13028]|uniref:Uncharacterized protein n=1 Tax=Brenneria nigrifluens DSM 30175 = ATCC 13028 TaxID=1121120 RepID=A0A2U1UW96_9GAMM|nr:hypothetical protein DDT54_01100 [Brenneria nigrifluens DSM 30175 = ATCC 13028]QCR05661.1 hypothetical protein EH206_16620 [Brenneria nigrifluens DSM 30175 = ATCC 13028]
MLTKSPVSRRYPGLPYRGALRRLTPLRPLATLSLITSFVNGLRRALPACSFRLLRFCHQLFQQIDMQRIVV